MTKEEKLELISEVDWYHCLNLGDGIITPGCNSSLLLDFMKLPENLRNKTLLDIGAWDGLYSFEAEKRGAEVLATDSVCWNTTPFEGSKTLGTKKGFDLAKRILESKIKEKFIFPEEISINSVGSHDIVLLLGVIYHVKNPILVIQNAWDVTKELMILESHIDTRFGEEIPYSVFYPNNELNNDTTNWWGPNLNCLRSILNTLTPSPTKVELINYRPDCGRAIFHISKQ